MEHATNEHLLSLKETHRSRLETLEIQAAQLGVECPPHITTEIKDIEETLREIDRKLVQTTTPQRFVLTDDVVTKPKLLPVGLLMIILIIGFILWVVIRGAPLLAISDVMAEDQVHFVTCRAEFLQTSLISLRSEGIVWHHKDLDNAGLILHPIGSKVHIVCHDSIHGRLDIVLVRMLIPDNYCMRPIWMMARFECSHCQNQDVTHIVPHRQFPKPFRSR